MKVFQTQQATDFSSGIANLKLASPRNGQSRVSSYKPDEMMRLAFREAAGIPQASERALNPLHLHAVPQLLKRSGIN
jgi:hypothetical protein